MEPFSGVVFGIICALIAPSRGRSALAWFFLGFFLNCFALIILLLIQDLRQLEQDQAEQERLGRELRRLREQVKRERSRNEERYLDTSRRLDAHDQLDGVDTRRPPALPGSLAALPPGHPFVAAEWWYAQPGEDDYRGPYAAVEFGQLLVRGDVGPRTLVWCETLTDWTEAGSLAEFREYFDA
ncbi:MAG: DUF4339 domain-containing protein [Planctomycetes bacterium]|nr:DUF4339 domain-containing protein [Planctomycetota bacterium]